MVISDIDNYIHLRSRFLHPRLSMKRRHPCHQRLQQRRCASFILCVLSWAFLAGASAQADTGFLIVAQDRGFVGNKEIRELVDAFAQTHPVALAWQGRQASGFEQDYIRYLDRAIQQLEDMGTQRIVVIPMFVSAAHPVLKRTRATLAQRYPGLVVQWAPTMASSDLIGQVLLDHTQEISQNPAQERVILLGLGAVDEQTASGIQTDIQRLAAYLTRYLPFQAVEIFVYYDPAAPEADERNQHIKAQLIERIAKKGRTLIVPAFIGPKYDYSMSMANWLGQFFAEHEAVFQPKVLVPHPNILLWLAKTANTMTPPKTSEAIGIVLMPHGATQPYNDAIERLIAPLRKEYRIEMAYGMGDPQLLQEAISRLEQAGATHIVVVRMYSLAEQFQAKMEYLLGLSTTLLNELAEGDVPPPQVRSAARFITFGGYEEDPRAAQILCERIREVSTNPAKETVLLLAHGAKSEERNAKWLTVMHSNIARLRSLAACQEYRTIYAATLREDWPTLRDSALDNIRSLIERASRHGKVLVIANRLYGAGPYRTLLDGLVYTLNDKGFLHPLLREWLRTGIEEHIARLYAPDESPHVH
ncbi:MAG: hypothetical protein D6690_02300 [Nitrospirae bacterium]|nr:MAG: hypothetical protein D6690_02300 [Nitrospirota bacterium]